MEICTGLTRPVFAEHGATLTISINPLFTPSFAMLANVPPRVRSRLVIQENGYKKKVLLHELLHAHCFTNWSPYQLGELDGSPDGDNS